MKILYGEPASVFVRKPRILLQEKNLKFITKPVNPMLEVSESFKNISPLGKIPVFQDNDYTLADSSAICFYLEKKYPNPSFYPQEPEELGKALWLEEYADTALFQAIAPCYYQTVLVPLYRNRQPDEAAINIALQEKLPPVANYLEQQLISKPYLVNHQFTIADIAVTSIFQNMYLSGFPLSKSRWPYLHAYLQRNFQRASFHSCINDVELELSKIKRINYQIIE
ncbi:glutathione S-transferase family protein [Legionella brunensis]|uniref:Stringent starvation protein A n=1 Tax=Legionella brunensis TaxID=29422 RepID=A0A0W0S2X6_9GAMM|nr:glutathione S-transferase family protein [Legionella brunensis]KTC77895.1 stringent starvation protein A [Legionella brunensis]